jgi:hypothetical protein
MITVFDVLILLGLILIIFGCGFFILATIMERYYDRKNLGTRTKTERKV